MRMESFSIAVPSCDNWREKCLRTPAICPSASHQMVEWSQGESRDQEAPTTPTDTTRNWPWVLSSNSIVRNLRRLSQVFPTLLPPRFPISPDVPVPHSELGLGPVLQMPIEIVSQLWLDLTESKCLNLNLETKVSFLICFVLLLSN